MATWCSEGDLQGPRLRARRQRFQGLCEANPQLYVCMIRTILRHVVSQQVLSTKQPTGSTVYEVREIRWQDGGLGESGNGKTQVSENSSHCLRVVALTGEEEEGLIQGKGEKLQNQINPTCYGRQPGTIPQQAMGNSFPNLFIKVRVDDEGIWTKLTDLRAGRDIAMSISLLMKISHDEYNFVQKKRIWASRAQSAGTRRGSH